MKLAVPSGAWPREAPAAVAKTAPDAEAPPSAVARTEEPPRNTGPAGSVARLSSGGGRPSAAMVMARVEAALCWPDVSVATARKVEIRGPAPDTGGATKVCVHGGAARVTCSPSSDSCTEATPLGDAASAATAIGAPSTKEALAAGETMAT